MPKNTSISLGDHFANFTINKFKVAATGLPATACSQRLEENEAKLQALDDIEERNSAPRPSSISKPSLPENAPRVWGDGLCPFAGRPSELE